MAKPRARSVYNEADRQRRIEELVAESKLEPTAARLALAETVVDMRIELDAIRIARSKGLAKADEIRTMPSLANRIGQLLDRLGLTAADPSNLRRVSDADDDDMDDNA